ncbi:hypothetical protein ACHAWU_001359 [Discostella pseudostelligera]|uniref:Uncharacterized protein n=1 Tax=Discostella pseudostelligera TaxID=259834 RepID=A0ABD3M5D6_9STRA
MNASTNDDNKVVDQTILWAREALQRRRRELQEQKQKLISSYNEEAGVVGLSGSFSSPGRCDLLSTVVQSTLERGRALLAEADAHSEILRKYASFGNDIVGTFRQDGGTDELPHHCSESQHHTPGGSNVTTPVESPDLENESHPMTTPDESDGDEDEEQDEMLSDGKGARASLDELITNISHHDESEIITPEKRISTFDPSTMNSAKRAIIKKLKLDEAVATAEEQARLLTSFKALPLPGGVEVMNNLYATTQAFEGKHIGSVEKLIRRRDTKCEHTHDESSSIISGTVGTRDDFSSVRSMYSRDNSFIQSECDNDADREKARELLVEKKMKKRQLLNSVNLILSEDKQSVVPVDMESSELGENCDFVEDPAKLRQDVARLEAKLKQKKPQRDATLNDIVDIDLNGIFDRFLPGESSDEARQIIDRLKERVFGCVGDFHFIPATVDTTSREALIKMPKRISVVQRQEEWSKRREQKLFNARMQLEADAMDSFTGKPEISHTAQSWKRAKESHDETLKIIAEVEEKKIREKAAREKALNDMKAEEERQLQEQAKSKPKVVKCEVNKEEQMKRLEMISRPRQTVETTTHVEPSTDADTSMHQHNHYSPKRVKTKKAKKKEKKFKSNVDRYDSMKNANNSSTVVSALVKKPDEFCGLPSFSDMSDKEFAKLVKRISKNALTKVKESEQIIDN